MDKSEKIPVPEIYREPLKELGLRYVYDSAPGITRRRRGKGFSYLCPEMKSITCKKSIARIKALAVPPAWEKVWICVQDNGHLQATGYDDKQRKQYRYHADWENIRNQNKYGNMITFGNALPGIRRKIVPVLAEQGLSRERVIAAVIRLLDKTGLRIGNDAYTQENKSFGLTTLRKKHVDVNGSTIELDFIGKSQQPWNGEITDANVAKIISACEDLPGYRLFQYIDENGAHCPVESGDVNAYLQEITGTSITAKDFRTWHACTLFVEFALACVDKGEYPPLKAALKNVSDALGNTPAIVKSSYLHPQLLEIYKEKAFDKKPWNSCRRKARVTGLRIPESILLCWLESL